MNDRNAHIDWVLVILLGGMFFFTGIILFTEWKYPMDGQLYQTFAQLLAGFSGAFFGRITPRSNRVEPPPDSKVTRLTVTEPPTKDSTDS